jgi:hypothetical protein
MILPLERRGKELKLFVEHVSDKIKWNRHRQSDDRCDKREFESGAAGFGGEERANGCHFRSYQRLRLFKA